MNGQPFEQKSAPTLGYEGHLPPPPPPPVRRGCFRAAIGFALLVLATGLMTVALGAAIVIVRHLTGSHRMPTRLALGVVALMGTGSLPAALAIGVIGLRLIVGRRIGERKKQE